MLNPNLGSSNLGTLVGVVAVLESAMVDTYVVTNLYEQAHYSVTLRQLNLGKGGFPDRLFSCLRLSLRFVGIEFWLFFPEKFIGLLESI